MRADSGEGAETTTTQQPDTNRVSKVLKKRQ